MLQKFTGAWMQGKVWSVAVAMLWCAAVSAQESHAPTTPAEKVGYAIGVDLVHNFKKQGIDVDAQMLTQGIRDALKNQSQMSDDEVHKVLSGFQGEVRRKIAQNRRQSAMENREKSQKFFAENKSKPGVVTLPSGVQYRVVKTGGGAKPDPSDFVVVNYTGTLLDGTVFDKTEAGKPAKLKIAMLITGWKEIMTLMPIGSKWQVWVPPEKAYGERGAGTEIEPNEALAFDIELLDVAK